jgi:ArsR family transcriptional regulator
MGIDFSRGAKLYKALSDETRVRIVHILYCGEVCACDIQEYLTLSQPTLSHHLAILTEAGIVSARAEGKVEVPVMLMRVRIANRATGWFPSSRP